MLQNKLKAFVTSGVKVSEIETKAWYDWSRASVSLNYLLVAPASYGESFSPKEGELKKYFEKNRSDYQTQPQVQALFVRFDPEQYKSEVDISEGDIAEYYESHTKDFKTEETVEARHILIRVDADAPQADVEKAKEKADGVYAKARAGEDFAALAKTYSEGPTRESGGQLGAFTRGRMVKPFEDKAFSMAPGDVSEPVADPIRMAHYKGREKDPRFPEDVGAGIRTNPRKSSLWKEPRPRPTMRRMPFTGPASKAIIWASWLPREG